MPANPQNSPATLLCDAGKIAARRVAGSFIHARKVTKVCRCPPILHPQVSRLPHSGSETMDPVMSRVAVMASWLSVAAVIFLALPQWSPGVLELDAPFVAVEVLRAAAESSSRLAAVSEAFGFSPAGSLLFT